MTTSDADRPRSLFGSLFFSILFLYPIFTFGSVSASPTAGSDGDASDCGAQIYGISCDDFQFEKKVVKKNQNLSRILLAHNVSHESIDAVAKNSEAVFDFRKIKAGNPYCIIKEGGTDAAARFLVYEQDSVNYVVYNLTELNVYLGSKPVETRIEEAAAVIRESLSKTFSRLGLEYDLVEKLSEIYAWTIDFHHLQAGDRFKLIYERQYVEDLPIGPGKILAAEFIHKEEAYRAFHFEQEESQGYYDESGNSLRKSFLKAPLKYTRITSLPSTQRLHPILNIRKPHLGIDYAAPTGTPVYSVGEGVIFKTGFNSQRGKYIVIRHPGLYRTEYLHLDTIRRGIKEGVRIQRGDLIGNVGSTGLATGPHLEFRFWKNDRVFDHLNTSLPPEKAIPEGSVPIYEKKMEAFQARIEAIPDPASSLHATQVAEAAVKER
jgi:murein DD-endopeptidase MepM/ murein hydrolase activator NlpD